MRKPGKRAKRRLRGKWIADRLYGWRRWTEKANIDDKQFRADRALALSTQQE